MRCTRCDEIAVPSSVGWTDEGQLVFGWCFACMEDRECVLVDDKPDLGAAETLSSRADSLRSREESRVLIADVLRTQAVKLSAYAGNSLSDSSSSSSHAISPAKVSAMLPPPWFPGGLVVDVGTDDEVSAMSRNAKHREGFRNGPVTGSAPGHAPVIPSWIQSAAMDPTYAVARLGKLRKLAYMMELWALVLGLVAGLALMLSGGEFRSESVNGSPLILFLGAIVMACVGFFFWYLARGIHYPDPDARSYPFSVPTPGKGAGTSNGANAASGNSRKYRT